MIPQIKTLPVEIKFLLADLFVLSLYARIVLELEVQRETEAIFGGEGWTRIQLL